MKAKKVIMMFALALVIMLGYGVTDVSTIHVSANELGDDLGEDTESSDGGDLSDYISNHESLTGEQLSKADKTLSPVTNFIGYLIGGGLVLVFALVFLITVLDLLYITVPPIRNLLYKAGTDGTGGYTGGMPASGYGMRGGMYGGMQAAGAGGAAGGSAKPTQWISDEAVQCAAMLGGSAQAGPMGGPYGGMGMNAGMPQQMPMKSVIGTYFKKRIFFMILLALCAIVLTSSILLGTGVNLAKWFMKLLGTLNNSMAS